MSFQDFIDRNKYYFFGNEPASSPLSYEALQTRRKIAQELLGKASPFPKNIGEGLTYLGEKIAQRQMLDYLDSAERRQAGFESGIRSSAPPEEYAVGAPRPGTGAAPVIPADDPRTAVSAPEAEGTGGFNFMDAAAPPLAVAPSGSSDVHQVISNAAKTNNLNPDTMRAIASIESGFNPGSNRDKRTQYKGLFQMGPEEWAAYGGGGDIYNPQHNAEGAGRLLADHAKWFQSKYGRSPTDPELYMMHQQGRGFFTNGTMTNIAGNSYPGMRGPQTPQTFMEGWGRELERRKGGVVEAAPPTGRNAAAVMQAADDAPEPGSPADDIRSVQAEALADYGRRRMQQGGPLGVEPEPPAAAAMAQAPVPDERDAIAQALTPPPTAAGIPSFQRPGGVAPAAAAPLALGGAAAPPIATDIKPAPDLLPSQQAIPQPRPQEMEPPGLRPEPPPRLGPSKAMQYWDKIARNPNVSKATQEYAQEQIKRGDEYRKELQAQQQEAYCHERDKWEVKSDAYAKFQREAYDRGIEQQIKLTGIENTIVDITRKRMDMGEPFELATKRARLEVAQAERNLAKPDTVAVGGTHMERPYTRPGEPQAKFTVPPGLPPLEEKPLTEAQVKAKTFVDRVKPDLDRLEFGLNHGKVLATSPFSSLFGTVAGTVGAGNIPISQEYRTALRPAENFAAAFMTHVSGAAYGEKEAVRNLASMLPQYKDTQQDLEEKSRRRRQYVNSLAETLPGSAEAHAVLAKANADYNAYETSKLPPLQITATGDDAMQQIKRLPPGRRFIDPNGVPRRVPLPE
jgi:hypothetical protein